MRHRHSILALITASVLAAGFAVSASADDPSPATSGVTATVTSGNLVVTGTKKADDFELSAAGGGKWNVVGHNGTTINGAPSIVTATVTGNVDINLNNGNDNVSVHDGDVPGHLTSHRGQGR